ncbi:MAG: hydroxymethylbilane synthase [Xanthobacteraceae bacterium]|jgi:hydroxymethylbilane synthase
MAQSTALSIGTRGSPLALAQAREVRACIAAAYAIDPEGIELRVIRTSGDMVQDRPLTEIGGKGLFTKEIDQALIDGAVDLAVHSAKDLPTVLPLELAIVGYLPREDARDAFISRKAKTLAALAAGAVVGTASLRRQAMVKRLRPDLRVALFRGNVETRLRKLDEGVVDATLLAMAGLNRLGRADAATSVLGIDAFPPAVGQGAIAICARADNDRIRELLQLIVHPDTGSALAAERAFLAVLDGSCRTPIAGHAVVNGGNLQFYGLILRPDGSAGLETMRHGDSAQAAALGADAGAELKSRAPVDFFLHG